MTQTSTLPAWDLSSLFPSLESPEFQTAFASAVAAIDALEHLFDQHNINGGAKPADATASFEAVIGALNPLLNQLLTLNSFVSGQISTNTRNAAAQARQSELEAPLIKLSKLSTRLRAWIGGLDGAALQANSQLAREHAYMIKRSQVLAAHQMSPELEELAAELSPTGARAWGRLYRSYSSQLMVPFEIDGKTEHLPISAIRNLAHDPNRDVRRRAYEAELATWEAASVPIAAAMNSIKGEVVTLARRRGWGKPLDIGLFDNNIDQTALDAMMQAAHESFPDFRRYFHAKARALKVDKLAFYDLFAPVGQSNRTWSYDEAKTFIVKQFGSFSPRLRGLAERAFDENWIDAEPRSGKVGGAFCMGVRPGESRILTNYSPSFSAVSTLAHELGHAYHNLTLHERTALQRDTPMTLAETASIFCETIVVQAALAQASAEEQLLILEASLQDSCQVVVDITSRFLFEQHVFDGRINRELSANEFCTLMRDAQLATYGDGLDPNALHPYMWAAKPHYYGSLFYNYPYMFGLLFGLGLYAHYQRDPENFKAGYDDLLSSTGLNDAATLAQRFGIDIRSADFWRSSLDVIRGQINRFEQLVG